MKGKKSNKPKHLPKKKLSTAEAIAKALAPKQPRPPKPPPKTIEETPKILEIIDNQVCLSCPVPEIIPDFANLDGPMTLRELLFIELRFVEEMEIDKAMIQAGYGDHGEKYRYLLAQKIVKKYESLSEDSKKIFQDVGFGQLTIAQGIKNKALNAKSEMVSLNAYQLAARCTRMLEEPAQSHQGVNIIINCGTEPAGGPGAPARPVNVSIQGEALPAKPMQITK